ncbi:MAG: competence/damage-inducible protein A [Armatimonadota bacterium]
MRAEIISVGTELLLGQIVDTDAAHLSRLLAELGIDLYRRSTVGDNYERAVEMVRTAVSRADIVFTIGGLGPTEDDLTKEAAAEALGVELVLDEDSANRVREYFASRGLHMPERNIKQAFLPKEGRGLPNDFGTAPGAVFEHDGKIVICLPGPPQEFVPMVEQGVLPYLREKTGGRTALIKSKVLKIAGLGESAVEEQVLDLLGSENPTVAPLAHPGEVHLRITAKADDMESADRMIREVELKLRERLGDVVFGADGETLEQVAVERLIEKKLTLALAESCTGGLLSNRITNIPGSSAALLAGIVAYSNESKVKFLGVPRDIIEKHGAVSHETAKAMASGVRIATGANIGMGITGIAGPGGATATKPVGLVYIAISSEGEESSVEYRFAGSRLDVKARSAQAALVMLRCHLL